MEFGPDQVDVLTHVYEKLRGSGVAWNPLGQQPTNGELADELASGFPFLENADEDE